MTEQSLAAAKVEPERGRPIRVAFDHRIFIYQPHGGMSRYYAGLAAELHHFGIDPRILAPFYTTERLKNLPKSLVWGRSFSPTPLKQRAAQILGELSHNLVARAAKTDIVHETFYNYKRRAPASCPIVTTVHDMIPELFPQFFPGDVVPLTKKCSIERADHIICDSQSTKRDLLRFYPDVEPRTSVVLLGFDASFADDAAEDSPIETPYILFVGGRGGWKNFTGLLEAFGGSRLPGEGIDLVCVGGGALSPQELELIARYRVEGRVRQVEADDQALLGWYRHAVLFAYPSLYEGFGIPPLEAMAAGCPVVAGHGSSLPEVCGNAVEWAVPGNVDSLVAALEVVAFSPARQMALRDAGNEQYKRFSWRKCAGETADIYKQLV